MPESIASVPLTILADERTLAAALATTELFSKLRMPFAFAGELARSAWLGVPVAPPSIEVLALISSDRSQQIPMMAANNGFEVDRDAVEAASELELIPLGFPHPDGPVRIHVLMASNALYAKMINGSVNAEAGTSQLAIVNEADYALLLRLGDDERSREDFKELLNRSAGFDRQSFNEKLISIGLRGRVVNQ